MEQPRVTVDASRKVSDFRADVSASRRIQMRAIDRDHLAFIDRYGKAARVGAIQRTRRIDDGFGALEFFPCGAWLSRHNVLLG